MPRLYRGIEFLLDHFIWVILILSMVAFTLTVPNYLAPSNLINILLTASVPGVMVIGQALVLMTRRIDLSAEGVISLVSVLAAWLMLPYRGMDLAQAGGIGWEVHPFIVIPLILALGAFIGFLNGFMIMKLSMNFFIVTLAMQLLLRGIAFVISQGAVMPGTPELFDILGSGRVGPVPVSVIVLLMLYAMFAILMSRTRFGRKVYAVGGNEEAARAAGFSPARTTIIVYTISGLLAAVGGWMLLGRVDASVPTLGAGFTLNVVAAAVIGGVSLRGGEGTIVGALGGVLFLALINNALNLSHVDPLWVDAVRGGIILLALITDAFRLRYKKRSLAAPVGAASMPQPLVSRSLDSSE